MADPEGREKTDDDWTFPEARTLGMMVTGDTGDFYYTTEGGLPQRDLAFLVLMNSFWEEVAFTLPEAGRGWEVWVDTMDDGRVGGRHAGGMTYPLAARSLALLVRL